MKIIRASKDGVLGYYELEGAQAWPLEGVLPTWKRVAGAGPVPLSSLRLRAPCVPSKIVAVGPNYKAHLGGNPLPPRPFFWIKPPSTLNDPEGVILLTDSVTQANHEPELAIVIGRTAKNVAVEQASDYVLGYTCINDVTEGPMHDPAAFMASMGFVDGKIHDTFAPLGPWIETSLTDTADLRIQCRVNGQPRQDHSTKNMIFTPAQLIALASARMTLLPGDVIATGAPPGVGALRDGDVVEVEVEGVGVLRNTVRREDA